LRVGRERKRGKPCEICRSAHRHRFGIRKSIEEQRCFAVTTPDAFSATTTSTRSVAPVAACLRTLVRTAMTAPLARES